MRYLKSFNESIQFETDYESILQLLTEIAPPNIAENDDLKERVRIHPDGTVDVIYGSISIDFSHLQTRDKNRDFTKLPIKFGYVQNYFKIYDCSELKSLEGCPHTCGSFHIRKLNSLKSLVGGPKNVELNYRIEKTPITSLIGSPERVGRWFDVEATDIKSLEGSPKQVGTIDISSTLIENFIGGPEIVENTIRADRVAATSLEGLPKEVGHLHVTPMKSYHGIYDPRPMKDHKIHEFFFGFHPIWELISIFDKSESEQEDLSSRENAELIRIFIESLDYNYVRGPANRPYINLFRLKEALSEFDIENPLGEIRTLRHYPFVDDEGREVDFDGNPI